METKKINSAYLYSLLLKKDPAHITEFMFHIKKDSNHLSRRYSRRSLFSLVLFEQSDDVIRSVVEEIKNQSEYSKFNPMDHLGVIEGWMMRGPKNNEVLWVYVMSLYTDYVVDGDRIEQRYFNMACQNLKTPEGWFDFVEMIGEHGCSKIIRKYLFDMASLKEGYPECCVPIIMSKSESFCKHETLVRLAFLTRHCQTIQLFKKEELAECLVSIGMREVLQFLVNGRTTKDLVAFKDALYMRITGFGSSAYYKCVGDTLRDNLFSLDHAKGQDDFFFVFSVDKRNGVVYREKDYVILLLKLSGFDKQTEEVFNEWYKHYGCRGTSMVIEQTVVIRLGRVLSTSKFARIWFRNVPLHDDGRTNLSKLPEDEKINVGVCLLKNYIKHERLLALLLFHGLIDLTVYTGNQHDLRLVVCHKDSNPMFNLMRVGQDKHRVATMMSILNQISVDTPKYMKMKNQEGQDPVVYFVMSSTIPESLSGRYESFKKMYDLIVCRSVKCRGDVFEMQMDSGAEFSQFLVYVCMLFGDSTWLSHETEPSDKLVTDVHILKKMMQKGGDISFLGDLFSDYQAYYFSKRIAFGNVYVQAINDKISSYLDVRTAFKNNVFLDLMKKDETEGQLSYTYVNILNLLDFKVKSFEFI